MNYFRWRTDQAARVKNTFKFFVSFAPSFGITMTHGVIGNTSDFGSAESWFEPRWVNKKAAFRGFFVVRGRGWGETGYFCWQERLCFILLSAPWVGRHTDISKKSRSKVVVRINKSISL